MIDLRRELFRGLPPDRLAATVQYTTTRGHKFKVQTARLISSHLGIFTPPTIPDLEGISTL
jgi:hypothetical protein